MTASVQIASQTFGASGLRLPRVALGCAGFGGVGSEPDLFGQGLSDAEAAELMDAAWELGITHFDTADAYGGGRSERAIGAWMAARGLRPLLTSKTFNPMDAGADLGLSAQRIHRQVRSSLERLGVDRIDLYLAHDFDPDVPLAETIGAFEQLRADGVLTEYGVSNFDAGQLRATLDAGAPVAVQNGYSLLEQGDEPTLAAAHSAGVAYIVFSPLSGGWLTGKYRRGAAYPEGSRMTQRPGPYAALETERTYDALEALGRFAAERGSSMTAVALAWLLGDERIAQVVVGPGRVAHLDPVREALQHPLTPEEVAQVSALFAG